jgi:hypothetical protein
MLDRIGDINLLARNARFVKRFVEKTTCGSDERMALAVFHVPRLLTDKHHRRIFGTFTENGLGSIFVEIASLARSSSDSQVLEGLPCWQKVRGRRMPQSCHKFNLALHLAPG